ncbi:MAG: hypothetical protein M1500_01820 [Candidatus Marsarchaeota archaeon]|jgi:hypothetical protein|nr:hypothetical protein [Candidatus Marsarchaeota archaeon]MCL5112434.1 hypothetical protein [Candidatus Marsarchaeota archaeon]
MKIGSMLKRIYTPKYLAINLVAAIAYFLFISFLLRYQNYGTLIVSVPMYILYLLSITASISLTIGIYSIGNTRNNHAKGAGSTAGTATTFVGSLVGGCGCHAPILVSVIALFGFGSAAFPIDVLLTENATPIFMVLIIINIAISIYYLNRLSNQKCQIDRRSNGRGKNESEGEGKAVRGTP